MSDALRKAVDGLYDAMANQDMEAYASFSHPDFAFVESPALPFAGNYQGIEGFQQLVGKVFELCSDLKTVPGATAVNKDHVMVWVDISLTGRATGKTVNTSLIEVFRFEGDKVIEIRPFYFDTDLVSALEG